MDKMITAWKTAVLENYVNFTGRLSVGGYWWFFLANFIIAAALYVLGLASSIFVILYVLYAIATFLPGLGAGVRRLHDTGKSGWMMLIALIPIVGPIVLIVFLASAGDPGQNAYGPPAPPVV